MFLCVRLTCIFYIFLGKTFSEVIFESDTQHISNVNISRISVPIATTASTTTTTATSTINNSWIDLTKIFASNETQLLFSFITGKVSLIYSSSLTIADGSLKVFEPILIGQVSIWWIIMDYLYLYTIFVRRNKFFFECKKLEERRAPWSCGLIHHVIDREVEGSSLTATGSH